MHFGCFTWFVSDLQRSFSIEFLLKFSRRSRASVFRAVAPTESGSRDTWLDIVLHPRRKAVLVFFKSRDGRTDSVSFSWSGLQRKTWLRMSVHFDESSSTVFFSSDDEIEQALPFPPNRVRLPFPKNTVFSFGGRSENAPTNFVVGNFFHLL